MKRVIIESPFAGKSKWRLIRWFQRRRNIRYARLCVRDSVLRGESPIASHLLFTQPSILNDDIPEERQLGINAGLAWRAVAEATVVYANHGISSGMQFGIDDASKNQRPVFYRLFRPGGRTVDVPNPSLKGIQ